MRKAILVLILAATLALAGCAQDGADDPGTGDDGADGGDTDPDDGSDGTAPGPDETVDALDNRFEPSDLSVSVGDTVEWVNQGSNPHTVTIRAQGSSDSIHDEEILSGESSSFTFEEAGTFEVWCKYHGSPGQGMAMTVQVG